MGINTLLSGKQAPTFTSQTLEGLGFSPQTAAAIETGAFLGASLGPGLEAAAGKATSIPNIVRQAEQV